MTPSVALTRASSLKEGAYHISAYKKKEEKKQPEQLQNCLGCLFVIIFYTYASLFEGGGMPKA